MTLPLYALDFGHGEAMAASVLAARGLGNMLGDLPAGAATARWGDRPVMQIGIAMMFVSTVLAGTVAKTAMLLICATGIGFAMATWLLARLALVGDMVASQWRGQALSTMAGLQRVGQFIGPALVGYSIEQLGFDQTFFILAAGIGMTLLFVNLSGRITAKSPASALPHQSPSKTHHTEPQASYTSVLAAHRRTWVTAGQVVMLLTLLRSARTLLIPVWGVQLELGAAEIGIILSLAAGFDMIMFPVAGLIMDRLGRRWSASACIALLGLGLGLIPFTTTPIAFATAAILAGIGNGLGSGINMTLGTDLAPAEDRGRFLGIWRLIGDSGSLIGPSVIGFLASIWSLKSAIWLVAASGPWAVVVLWLTVRETLHLTASSAATANSKSVRPT
tara:strand:+ start:480 stop:1649 length:1170 start_codon:yes stop_codon:yes gene_type:complete